MAPTKPYATEDDYTTAVTGTAPTDLVTYLRAASKLVYRACRNDLYTVDADDLPAHPTLRAAMRAATIEQVQAWTRLEVDPRDNPASLIEAATVTAASLGSGSYSVSEGSSLTVARMRAATITALVPDALAELRDAGLASMTVGI